MMLFSLTGCIPLLVQLVQSDKDADTRKKASQALHNLIYAQPDEKLKKRESRVLKLLEQARLYTEALKNNTEYVPEAGTTSEGNKCINNFYRIHLRHLEDTAQTADQSIEPIRYRWRTRRDNLKILRTVEFSHESVFI